MSDVNVSNSAKPTDSGLLIVEPFNGVPTPKGRQPVGTWYSNTKGTLVNLWQSLKHNLGTDFTTTNTNGVTVVALSDTGVVAGVYANATVTTDSKGRITAISVGSGGGVPTTRTLTINGVSYDLSANRTWSVGDMLKADNLSGLASTATSRTNLGATTVGSNFFTATNPSAITFVRINADNSVSLLNAADFLTAIGASAVTPAALTKVDDTNVTLTLGGTPATALLQASSLTLGWTGQLGLSRGGTNKNLTAVNGGVVYTDADSMEVSAAGTSGQYLQSAGAATPVWVTEKKMWSGGIGSVIAAGATNYANIGIAVTLTENNTKLPFCMAGTLIGFGVQLGSAQPASGSLVVTLRKNGASTALTFTIAAGSAAGDYSDLVNTDTFTATDDYNIMIVNNAAANSGRVNGVTFIYSS